MYVLLYGHKNEAQRLACMCYYTAMKLRSKVNVYVLLYSHESEVQTLLYNHER